MAVVREVVREEPVYHEHRNNNSTLIWAVVLIVLLVLVFTYGLPVIRSLASRSGTQINIPDHINVNVNNPNAPQAPQGGGMNQPPTNP